MWTDIGFLFRATAQRLHSLVYGRALSLTLEISEHHHSHFFSTRFSANVNPIVVSHPNPSTSAGLSVRLCHRVAHCPPSGHFFMSDCTRLQFDTSARATGEQQAVQSVCADSRRRWCQPLRNVLFNHVFSLVMSEWNLGCDMMWCMICSLRCYLSVLLWQSEDSRPPVFHPSVLSPFFSSSSSAAVETAALIHVAVFDCQGSSNLSSILPRFCFQIFAKQMYCCIIYCFWKSLRIAVQCWKKYWWLKLVIIFLFNESVLFWIINW